MTPDLPPAIAAYYAAANARNLDATVACFASDAKIEDDGETLVGQAAIRAWKEGVFAKFESTAEPRQIVRDGDAYLVTALVSGNFPGSPIDLDHRFALAGSAIATLVID